MGKKNIHIFPILSNDDTCSQFIRSYQSNWLQRQRSAADNNNNKKPDASNAASQVLTLNSPGRLQHHSRGGGNGGSSSSSSQYVSHYLLQIEPIKGKVLQLKH